VKRRIVAVGGKQLDHPALSDLVLTMTAAKVPRVSSLGRRRVTVPSEDGITDSYGPTLRPLGDGLGWLSGSACPHYDGEPARRPTYTAAVGKGCIAPGYAADDGVAVVFEDERFVEAVTARPDGRAFHVGPSGERPLPVRRLSPTSASTPAASSQPSR
jgi:hypothetical protein